MPPAPASTPVHPSPFRGSNLSTTLLNVLFLLCAAAVGPVSAPAQDIAGNDTAGYDTDYVASLSTTVRAVRLHEPVIIDGVLDEPVWHRPSAAPLIQNDPHNGRRPSQQTDWWVAFDDEAVYVAARLHDTSPDSIVSRLARRDTWIRSDWFYINFDTFNDDRNGYSFAVNPAGCITDAVLYNDGWDDNSWDPIWDQAATIDDGGWSVEVRIPFDQLNFPATAEQVWGINVSRRLVRENGRDELFHNPRDESGYMRRFPDLVGIRGISPVRQLEVLGYVTGSAAYVDVDPDNPFRSDPELGANAGADINYDLGSNLNLTATVNPDFGQVEVDPATVNLSDFETFFEEKRPFFIKDASIFRFGRDGTNNNWGFNWMDPMPFYSRRIGRRPQLALGAHDYAEDDTKTTILGAAKVSGKLGNTHVGLLTAVTAEEEVLMVDGCDLSRQVVEPLTSYSVLRVTNSTPDGDRGIGLMATNVRRDMPSALARDQLTRNAASLGVDGFLKLDEDKVWAMRGYLSGSYVQGSAAAITDLQRSSRRYYQKPDAKKARLDTTATNMKGWMGRVMLNKESGVFTLNTAVGAISPGYETNDLGFQTRAAYYNTHVAASVRKLDPGRTFRWASVSLAGYKTWNFDRQPMEYGAGLFYNATFLNYWAFGGSFFYNPERDDHRTTRGGPVMRVPEYRSADFWFDTDTRKPLYFNPNGNIWSQGGTTRGFSAGVAIVVKPRDNVELTFEPRYQWEQEHAQYVDTIEDATATHTYGHRYVFGELEYRQFAVGTRINWTFTPRLTLQAYLQPFFASGRYTNLKEYAKPRTYEFASYRTARSDDGDYVIDPDGAGPSEEFTLSDPDFNFKSLKVNMVLRWEYRPGATFFFVWTQDRVDFSHPGDFDVGRDSRALLDAPGDDVFLVKASFWVDI